jgi:CheY-like chemotaxis protein
VVDTSGGFLGNTVAALEHLRVFLVNKSGQVTTVVQDQVEALAILEGNQLLFKTPFVLLLSLSLPCEDGNTSSSNCCGGVVLSGENVAG